MLKNHTVYYYLQNNICTHDAKTEFERFRMCKVLAELKPM